MYGWGFNPRAAEIRRRIDVDYLDERLIRQGFLDRYNVLVFSWGNIVPEDVLKMVDKWIRAGGTVIFPPRPRGSYKTVDGNTDIFLSWQRGDTGDGAFYRFNGDIEPISFYGDFVENILIKTSHLHPLTKQVLEIQHPERVFFSVLEDGRVLALNFSDKAANIELDGDIGEALPPFSIKLIELR